MKKTLIASIFILFSTNNFAETKSEKDSMYCYSVPQKQGIYMCKTWAELSLPSNDDKLPVDRIQRESLTKEVKSAVPVAENPKDKPLINIRSQSLSEQNAKTPSEQIKSESLNKEVKLPILPAVDPKSKPVLNVRPQGISEHNDKTWMIQVALASNQMNADNIASKLKAKGYSTKTSANSKGVRVLVGPNDYQTANDLKGKIQGDASLGIDDAKSAWLLNWNKSKQ